MIIIWKIPIPLSASDIATKYHYKDLILRINTALGVK